MSDASPGDQPRLPKLTRRRRRWADEFLTGVSGAEACRRMGMKGTPQQLADRGYKIHWRPEVQAYLKERRQDILDAAGVRQEEIVRELKLIAFQRSSKQIASGILDADGNLLPPDQQDDDASAIVAGIDVEELFEGRGEARKHIGRVRKFKTWDKNKALDSLARIGGMNKDKLEHGGEIKATGGVLIVPAAPSEEAWSKAAEQQQSALAAKERTFNV